MSNPFLHSVSMLWSSPGASFVRLESAGNYFSFTLFVVVLVVVTAIIASLYSQLKIKVGLYKTVENLVNSGQQGGGGAFSGRASTRAPRRQTFTFRNWSFFAMLAAGMGICLTQMSTPNKEGTVRGNRFASYTETQPVQENEATVSFSANQPGGQYFNQAPQGAAKSTFASATDQAQHEVEFEEKVASSRSRQPSPLFTDAKANHRDEVASPQAVYTVQLSSSSVEEFAMAKAKDVAGYKPGHRVYLYPDPMSDKIKVMLGTFTDREAAEAALSYYHSLSGAGAGFITTLPAQSEGNLFIVPG